MKISKAAFIELNGPWVPFNSSLFMNVKLSDFLGIIFYAKIYCDIFVFARVDEKHFNLIDIFDGNIWSDSCAPSDEIKCLIDKEDIFYISQEDYDKLLKIADQN